MEQLTPHLLLLFLVASVVGILHGIMRRRKKEVMGEILSFHQTDWKKQSIEKENCTIEVRSPQVMQEEESKP